MELVNFYAGCLEAYSGKHLLLQPHLDDLPFSLGHMLHGGLLTATEHEIWTVFGLEFFNIRGLPHNQGTVELLHDEETRWFQSSGLAIRRLALEEAGYRGVNHIRKLFLPRQVQQATLDYAALGYNNQAAVLSHLKHLLSAGIDYVWAPAGIGGHCDHLAVRQSIFALLKDCQAVKGIFLYEELPYRQYSRPIDWQQFTLDGFVWQATLRKQPSPAEVARKSASIALFHSQITVRQAQSMSLEPEVTTIWLRAG